MAHHVEFGFERLPVVGERECVVEALVVREPPRELSGAGDPRGAADVAADVDRVDPLAGRAQDALPQALRRPGRLAAPLAAHLGEGRRGPGRTAGEDGDRRLLVDAVRLVGEPAAEPADQLRHEVDVRPRDRRRSRAVAPGPRSTRFGQLSSSKPRSAMFV